MEKLTNQYGRWRLFAVVVAALGLGHTSAAIANTLPSATMATGCITSQTDASQTCSNLQPGVVDIYAEAKLTDLTATANVNNLGPYSFSTYARVTYYMQLSSTNPFPNDYFFRVPVLVHAAGITDVGGTPLTTGTSFNHNVAETKVSLDYFSWSACSGFGCPANIPTSFNGTYLVKLQPFSSGYEYGSNIFQITISASASTNSDYLGSYAHAWADPSIEIEPTFLAAHPEISLSFSSNLPVASVPEPNTYAMLLLGLGMVGAIARRQVSAGK